LSGQEKNKNIKAENLIAAGFVVEEEVICAGLKCAAFVSEIRQVKARSQGCTKLVGKKEVVFWVIVELNKGDKL